MTSGTTHRFEKGSRGLRGIVLGVLAGGGLFVAVMVLLAVTAAALGWIRADRVTGIDLRAWMILEPGGGVVAGVLGGAVSRRIARSGRGPFVLSLVVLGLGLLEATEIMLHVASGTVIAPPWLVLSAPVAVAAAVLLGGYRPMPGRADRAARRAGSGGFAPGGG